MNIKNSENKQMNVLTVKEAVERVNSGGNLKGIVLDEQSMQQVNVRDAIVLSCGGIVIPEERIYYDDADIEYDEEIDELTITSGIVKLSWEEKAKKAAAPQKQAPPNDEHEATLELQLQLHPELKSWLDQQTVPIDQLIKQLLENFYRAELLLEKKGA